MTLVAASVMGAERTVGQRCGVSRLNGGTTLIGSGQCCKMHDGKADQSRRRIEKEGARWAREGE